MKIFKKLISIIVVSCFMLSIANLPAYSAYNMIEQRGTAQNQEEYNLQADYEPVNVAVSKPKATKTSKKVSKAKVNKTATQGINAINKLLKKKGISKLAKTWLKKAKALINSIKNGKKTNAQKATLLKQAIASIKKVMKAKGSDLSLAQQTTGVFSTLKKVLKNNIVYKIYAKYTTKGVNVIKTFAKKVGLKAKTVYNAFIKMGVTKTQMKKVGSVVLNLMKKGEKFVNCAANSISKFLNISRSLAAVYNLAADISIDATRFVNSNKKGFTGTYSDAQLKTLQKNGYKNASRVICSLSDFMSGLKVGEKAILHLDSFDTKGNQVGGHAIIVIREKSGYAVSNNLINGGNKIIFNATEFKKLIDGKKATGKTASGKKITTPVYYNTTSGKHSYKAIANGKITVITNSKDIINKQVVYNYNTNISITYQPAADTKSSLTSKIIKKYTKAGLTTLKAFANKLGLKLKTVYNQFVKYGVTKAQMKKVASGLLKIIKRGANFTAICSTLAVSKYLGISKAFTAVQQIAAEISLNYFNPNSTKYYMSTTWMAQAKVLSKNGVKNSEEYYVKLADLLNLRKGGKMLVNADCYNKKGQPDGCHAITITREKNGKYGIYDVLVNGGNKVIYTKAQIKRLLSGKSAKGKTTSGRAITKTKYLATAYGYLSYKFVNTNGNILIVGDSSKVITPAAKSSYNKSISLVNKLLKKKGLSKSAKTWLTKAKKLIINTLNSNKSYRKKEDLLDNAYSLLKQVSSKSVSTISLVTGSTSIFSSLKSILKNTLTYKIYGKYGENGAKVISAIAKKYNLSQSTVYNTFVNNKVTKGQMDFLWDSILNSLKDKNPFAWGYAYSSVNGAMASIKKLVDNQSKSSTASPKAPAAPKAVKKTSLTSKIIKKYTKKGLITLKALANKFGLKLKTVYNQFVKYGVTKKQMKKVASGLLKMIRRGADFCVCSTTAVSKYLGISKAFTAVQQIAAEISINYFNPNEKSHYIATTNSANAKILSKNGVKNAEQYSIKLADLLSMKKGTKIYVTTNCYSRSGSFVDSHAMTIVREKNGKFGVYDILVNGGNKVIYTKAQFKRLMNGNSAKGKTTSGRTITKSKYLASAEGYLRYKFVNNGGVSIIGDSTKIVGQFTKDLYKKNISTINQLLKKSNLSDLAKTWLKKAKAVVNKVYKSNKKDSVKENLLNGGKYWLANIKVGGATILSIAETSKGWSGIAPIFSSLTSVLKNNITYKIFNKYGKQGVTLIRNLSKKFNVSQNSIYTQLVKGDVDQYQLYGISADKFKTLNAFYSSLGINVLQSNNTGNTQQGQNDVDTNSIEYKINAKYGDSGVKLMEALSKHLNISREKVYEIFVKNGVSADTVKLVSSLIISDINEGENIFRATWYDDSLNKTLAELEKLTNGVGVSLAA